MCWPVSAGSVALRLVTLEYALTPDAGKRPIERVIWRRTQERVRACDSMRGFSTRLLPIVVRNIRITPASPDVITCSSGGSLSEVGGAVHVRERANDACDRASSLGPLNLATVWRSAPGNREQCNKDCQE